MNINDYPVQTHIDVDGASDNFIVTDGISEYNISIDELILYHTNSTLHVQNVMDLQDIATHIPGPTEGDVIVKTAGAGWVTERLKFAYMQDISSGSANIGDILKYNGSIWSYRQLSLNENSDVNINSPSDGENLIWDNTSGMWVNGPSGVTSDGIIIINDSQKIKEENPTLFGKNVTLSGDGLWAASVSLESIPKIYIYECIEGVWTKNSFVSPSTLASGQSVSLALDETGEYLVIGFYYESGNLSDDGAAFVYRRTGTTWAQISKIYYNGNSAQRFGYSVSVRHGKIAIGIPNYLSLSSNSSGAVAIYDVSGDTVSFDTLLEYSPKSTEDCHLGESVCISFYEGVNEYLVASGMPYANNTDSGHNTAGAVVMFKHDGSWSSGDLLYSDSPQEDEMFGCSVDIGYSSYSDWNVLVGARKENNGSNDSGKAYLIVEKWGWNIFFTFRSEYNSAPDDGEFGCSVAISYDGTMCFVGNNFGFDDGKNGDRRMPSGNISKFVLTTDPSMGYFLEEMFYAYDSTFGNQYGSEIAISDTGLMILSGSPFKDSEGALYYTRTKTPTFLTASISVSGSIFNIVNGKIISIQGS